jgi:GT2 family glycosyltransferase
VVVENASQPEERERLAGEEFRHVRVVSFQRNLGFAGAANEGIARTRSPFVLLVNNDAVLAPDYAARLAARLALDARLAAVQGLVLTQDGQRVDTAGLDWNRRGEAVPVLAGASAGDAPRQVFEVSGVSATATLYRREALESVATNGEVFDRSFFAYYEDVDLSLRLARAGWRFACDPEAVARHEGSLTGRRTPAQRALWTARNRWRTLFRNFDGRFLARRLFPLLRADLAHVRRLGWRGALLPVLVWPRLPVLAWRSREQRALLSHWPSASR